MCSDVDDGERVIIRLDTRGLLRLTRYAAANLDTPMYTRVEHQKNAVLNQLSWSIVTVPCYPLTKVPLPPLGGCVRTPAQAEESLNNSLPTSSNDLSGQRRMPFLTKRDPSTWSCWSRIHVRDPSQQLQALSWRSLCTAGKVLTPSSKCCREFEYVVLVSPWNELRWAQGKGFIHEQSMRRPPRPFARTPLAPSNVTTYLNFPVVECLE